MLVLDMSEKSMAGLAMKSFTINHSPKRIDNHSDIGSGKGREGPEERGMKYAFLTSGAT